MTIMNVYIKDDDTALEESQARGIEIFLMKGRSR